MFYHAKTTNKIELPDIKKTIPVGSLIIVQASQSGELVASDGECNFFIDVLEFTKATVH